MIKIVEVTTKKQWKIFAKFPIDLYKDNPYYVPVFMNDDVNMANPEKNKSAKNCTVKAFLAYKDDVLAGRIAGIIVHDSNDIYNQNQPLGDISDINTENWRENKETFLGYYGAIISRYKEISPDAKFFFACIYRDAP